MFRSLIVLLLLPLTSFSKSNNGFNHFIFSDQKVCNIKDFGAKGDGKTDDAKAIQQAIDACNAAGGGEVLVPAGATFLAGPFNLKSYVDFHVEPNAKVLANPMKAFIQKAHSGTIKAKALFGSVGKI